MSDAGSYTSGAQAACGGADSAARLPDSPYRRTARVLIGGLPAACMGDAATCAGPPDAIVKGSMTVLIGNRPAARMGDSTAHGGTIVAGFPTVMIGG
jgi:uncharacterized Zn-binding protein involved in type VI secretion